MQLVLLPADAGQGERAPARRRPTTLTLTASQRARMRAAIRNLRRGAGSWACLAAMLDVHADSLKNIVSGKRNASAALAQRVARLAGTTTEALLGSLAAADRCPACGATRGAT